jgi:hypothetical protein
MVEALSARNVTKKLPSCGTCHDPHSHDAAAIQPHSGFRSAGSDVYGMSHTISGQQSGAALTIPLNPQAPVSPATCHASWMLCCSAPVPQIDDIPNGEMTKRFGQEEAPPACFVTKRRSGLCCNNCLDGKQPSSQKQKSPLPLAIFSILQTLHKQSTPRNNFSPQSACFDERSEIPLLGCTQNALPVSDDSS